MGLIHHGNSNDVVFSVQHNCVLTLAGSEVVGLSSWSAAFGP